LRDARSLIGDAIDGDDAVEAHSDAAEHATGLVVKACFAKNLLTSLQKEGAYTFVFGRFYFYAIEIDLHATP
jgi:hypothetical protein